LLVVHDALEMMISSESIIWSFTPSTTYLTSLRSPFAGAEIITFRAPDISICFIASSLSTYSPVDSTTTSMLSAPHVNLPGSGSLKTSTFLPFIIIWSPLCSIVPSKRPCKVSYFNKWARLAESVMSLTAITSMFSLF